MSHKNFGARDNLTKLFHVTCHEAGMRICVQLFGACPPKILEGNNVQNLVRFQTTLDYDREYLWKRSRYQHAKKVINCNDSHVRRKTLGELWSTNNKVVAAKLYPPKINFFGRHYLGPYGLMHWCFLKFLHMLQNRQSLLTHTTSRAGIPNNLLMMKI